MPTAPDVASLYAYESYILPGWVQLLRQRGLNSFIQFSDVTKGTPYVDVLLDHVVPLGQQHAASNERLYWSAWAGWLIHRVYTQRGKNSDRQAANLKIIRTAALDFQDGLDDVLLPYHDIMFVKESPRGSGLRQGVDDVYNLDYSELPFEIQFSVRKASWPL